MQGFKLHDKSSIYHVTVHTNDGDDSYEEVSAFGVEIKNGCLIFYQADHSVELVYTPGRWLGVVKQNEAKRHIPNSTAASDRDAVSKEWVLCQLAGLAFPSRGQAYDYLKILFRTRE